VCATAADGLAQVKPLLLKLMASCYTASRKRRIYAS
jgi:hypothetical protein